MRARARCARDHEQASRHGPPCPRCHRRAPTPGCARTVDDPRFPNHRCFSRHSAFTQSQAKNDRRHLPGQPGLAFPITRALATVVIPTNSTKKDASRMGKTCSPDPLLASAERIEVVNGPALYRSIAGDCTIGHGHESRSAGTSRMARPENGSVPATPAARQVMAIPP